MKKVDLFGFFPIAEVSTQGAATVACDLAHRFSRSASNYGDGVKSITATLILTDPSGLGEQHKEERPKFYPGLRKVEAFGTPVELEDELEFSLRPEFASVSGINGEVEIARAIASALFDIHEQLRDFPVPNFDINAFLSALETFFATVSIDEVVAEDK